MTAVETREPAVAARPAVPDTAAWRKALAFGTSAGIVLREDRMECAIVRVRPSGAEIVDEIAIADFRNRPAAEWGSEFQGFLKRNGESYLAATVLLPRREVIVRHLALPGVSARDLASAIHFQLDSLHPFGDEEVVSGWSRADRGTILLGIVRRAVLDRYTNLFAEAGIGVAAFTFSAAAIHASLRLFGPPAAEFLAYTKDERGTVEVYGESAARPFFSAEFDAPVERALSLARAELRLAPGQPAWPLETLMPVASADPLVAATALSNVCPRLTSAANLLPRDLRKDHSRAHYVPSILLGIALLCVAGAMVIYPAMKRRQYLDSLRQQIARLQPYAARVQAIDKRIQQERARTMLLDEFRKRSQADLDTLNELTRLLPPPIWTNMIEIYRDSVTIGGEADQAAPLLKVLDASPFFQNSEFTMSVVRAGSNELFRIKAGRKARP